MTLQSVDRNNKVIYPTVGLASGQVNFSCPELPPLSKPARNVHELRPQDIKVVMALGDSITAGRMW